MLMLRRSSFWIKLIKNNINLVVVSFRMAKHILLNCGKLNGWSTFYLIRILVNHLQEILELWLVWHHSYYKDKANESKHCRCFNWPCTLHILLSYSHHAVLFISVLYQAVMYLRACCLSNLEQYPGTTISSISSHVSSLHQIMQITVFWAEWIPKNDI